jgi:hypothetical protein
MTEAEWLASEYLWQMLAFLADFRPASARKARLMGCAWCRRIWRSLTDHNRALVAAVEEHPEGTGDEPGLKAAIRAAVAGGRLGLNVTPADRAAVWLWKSFLVEGRSYQTHLIDCACGISGHAATATDDEAAERATQAALLLDVFGSPFHRLPAPDPAWLTWNGGTVTKVAQAIYDERAFDRLPVLADALEDAGCTDPELLGHLRSPGPHARGCWAVDLLLGKE